MFWNGDKTETVYADLDAKHAESYIIDVGILGDALIPFW